MNEFIQAPVSYCLHTQVKYKDLEIYTSFFENISQSIVFFEAEDTKSIDSKPEDLWQIDVYLENFPELSELQNQVNMLSNSNNLKSPILTVSRVEEVDWVSEVQKSFKPIRAGKFFIHYTGYGSPIPDGLIPIEINAGRAFGTGEHETTSNCLKAISSYAESGVALDMGCGSGILALALAKINFMKVVAVDIDIESINVTQENAQINKVEDLILQCGDGYKTSVVKEYGPYDLIVSNILAKPLINMAEDASINLKEGAIIILAGFLKEQKQEVLEKYESLGFKLVEEIVELEWPSLVMKKNNC